jgi:hypothetical protein
MNNPSAVSTCSYVYAYIHTYIQIPHTWHDIQTYLYTYIHTFRQAPHTCHDMTYIHAHIYIQYIHTYIHTYIYTYIPAYIQLLNILHELREKYRKYQIQRAIVHASEVLNFELNSIVALAPDAEIWFSEGMV